MIESALIVYAFENENVENLTKVNIRSFEKRNIRYKFMFSLVNLVC